MTLDKSHFDQACPGTTQRSLFLAQAHDEMIGSRGLMLFRPLFPLVKGRAEREEVGDEQQACSPRGSNESSLQYSARVPPWPIVVWDEVGGWGLHVPPSRATLPIWYECCLYQAVDW